MKPINTWIIVADGARARVLANKGMGKGLSPVSDLNFEGDHSARRDIMSDKPGRSFESASPVRHAMEPSSDPHGILKERFVAHLSDVVSQRHDEFDRAILIAPPKVLGLLRKALPPVVRDKVYHELAKDLTNLPNAELPEHLEDFIKVT